MNPIFKIKYKDFEFIYLSVSSKLSLIRIIFFEIYWNLCY